MGWVGRGGGRRIDGNIESRTEVYGDGDRGWEGRLSLVFLKLSEVGWRYGFSERVGGSEGESGR